VPKNGLHQILFFPIVRERTSPATALEWNYQVSPQAGFSRNLQILGEKYFSLWIRAPIKGRWIPLSFAIKAVPFLKISLPAGG
jgi:hypothetical protein